MVKIIEIELKLSDTEKQEQFSGAYCDWNIIFIYFFLFILRLCQHDDNYIDSRSQIKVHTNERT